MTRIINYFPKVTAAKTQYRDIAEEDMTWLKTEMIKWLSQMGELSQRKDADSRYAIKEWWIRSSQNLPKGQHGPNCPYSFVGGLVNNLVFGSQRDLSDRQCDALQSISHFMGGAFEGLEPIQFRMGFFENGR